MKVNKGKSTQLPKKSKLFELKKISKNVIRGKFHFNTKGVVERNAFKLKFSELHIFFYSIV